MGAEETSLSAGLKDGDYLEAEGVRPYRTPYRDDTEVGGPQAHVLTLTRGIEERLTELELVEQNRKLQAYYDRAGEQGDAPRPRPEAPGAPPEPAALQDRRAEAEDREPLPQRRARLPTPAPRSARSPRTPVGT